MKRFNKILLTLGLTGMVSLSAAMLTSCKETVTLSFNVNGGNTISDVSAELGQETTLPTPVREGFRFEGWYLNAEFEGEPVTTIVAESNATYYAKWTQVYAVTLDANGGTLGATTVYLEEGVNVYEALASYVPEKAGVTFGAWFNGNTELSTSTKMPAEGLTLTAQYKVDYSIEIYLQDLEGDGYTKSETVTGSEYVGKNYKAAEEVDGFKAATHDNAVTEKVLSETASENVFKQYFDRNTYNVIFNPNYPGASASDRVMITAKYGEKIEIPSDPTAYVHEGYCMLGWTTNATGSTVEYPMDMSDLLYNKDDETSDTKQELTVEGAVILYGVWQEAYTDLFGGNDYIFFMEGEEDVVYLSRGNIYFQGEYDSKDGEFYFDNENGKEVLAGKLFSNKTYVYYNEKRASTSVLYQAGVGLVEDSKIRFDTYNGITYTIYENGQTVEESKGTYEINDDGDYVATFTEGDKKGLKLIFILGNVTAEDGTSTQAFRIRSDEEYNMGNVILSGVTKDTSGKYTVGYVESRYFTFDGFGTATFVTETGSTRYNYSVDENGNYVLSDANDNYVGTLRLIDIANSGGKKAYMLYNETLNDTFELGENESLTLDGLYNATYKNGSTTITSYYTATSSPMGGTIVSIADDEGTEYKFLLTPKTVEVPGEDGKTTTKTTYTAKKVLSTYAEYYYKDATSIYYAPMLVIDETKKGYASLYGYTSERTFVKVSEGKYELNADGLYLYTVEETFDAPDIYKDPIDLSTIKSFVFALDSETTGYSVSYWYSSNDGETEYFVDYTSADGAQTLKLVGGFAFYKTSATASAITGAYSQNENILTLSAATDTYYFELDEENKKFTALQFLPYSAYLVKSDNSTDRNVYIHFDGKGGAVYTVLSDGEITETVAGAVTDVMDGVSQKETVFGDKVYKFTPTDTAKADQAFEFISVTVGSTTYYLLANIDYVAGRYSMAQSSAASGRLTIDGYCYKAEFTRDDTSYEGNYYLGGEDLIIMVTNDGRYFYFDMLSDGSFTVRGEEYGMYALYENQYSNGVFVELGGYGKLSVFTFELKAGTTDEYERKYVTQDGVYTQEGDVFTLAYGTGAEAKAYVCVVGDYSHKALDGETFKTFIVSQEVKKEIFVDTTDWSVLILDEFGGAIRYDKDGQKEKGSYTLITDTLLYFVNSAASDACIYEYDAETGEASPVELSAKSYYTEDLKSLYFSKYGFAIFNGDEENLQFYNYKGNNVIIYRHPMDGETPNAYGFVEYDFGLLEDTKEYNDETYYRNYGDDIIFTRVETNAKKYPLVVNDTTKWYLTDLQFMPSGGAEFNVSGKVTLLVETTTDGETSESSRVEDCTVTRTFNENGAPEMYVTIGGYYRFYITATYVGEAESQTGSNSYQVLSSSYVQTLTSYRYLDVLYRIYMMYGASSANAYTNEFGTLTITIDFNEDGTENRSVLTAEFGEATELYDSNGDAIAFEEATFQFMDNGLNRAEFTAADGYTYHLYFAVQTHSYLRAYGYYVYALVRLQDVEAGDYTVSVGRVVATEANGVEIGSIFTVDIKTKADGKSVGGEEFFLIDETIYYVARTKDADDAVIGATYYIIELEENESGSVEEEGKETVETYKSATVTVKTAEIKREEEYAQRYVEIVDGKVMILSLYANKYYVVESSYDEATKTYTVTTAEGHKYTVKVDGEYVLIES